MAKRGIYLFIYIYIYIIIIIVWLVTKNRLVSWLDNKELL